MDILIYIYVFVLGGFYWVRYFFFFCFCIDKVKDFFLIFVIVVLKK